MTKKLHVIGFFIFLNFHLWSQSKADTISISINWNKAPMELNKNYISTSKDTVKITNLKFYLSDFHFVFNDDTFYKDKNAYLVNSNALGSLKIPVLKENKKMKMIQFSIGIDSLASVSGALSGDLDLQKGMYWAWQSGYINMKIEGISSSCKTRKNAFNFHIGGYLEPYYALRKIKLYPNSTDFEIEINVAVLFDSINLAETNSIMIPGKQAMELADLSIKMFSIK